MTILKNAVEAIQIGLEDFKSEDPRRAHSALRNIFAGTLLIFKEKLRRMSPEKSDEVLLKQTISPKFSTNGDLTFLGKGNKTVDVQQIKDRFNSLQINVDWKILEEINKLRNNIEHYYAEESPAVINEIVSKSFRIIRDFCVVYLNEEPVILFGQVSWDIFLEADEIYEKEKEESIQSLLQIEWSFPTLFNAAENLRCFSCGSDLVHAFNAVKYIPQEPLPLRCKKCNTEFDFSDVIEECIEEELSAEAHIAAMDGGDGPYTECPECGKGAFVFSEEACLACGHEQGSKSCLVCGTGLDIYEAYEGEICSYHRYQMDKAENS